MSEQAIAILAGCALIAIAIFGGNIRAKDVEIGPISGVARILSGLFGLLMIAGAAGVLNQFLPVPTPTPTPTPTPIPSITVSTSPTPTSSPSAVATMAVSAAPLVSPSTVLVDVKPTAKPFTAKQQQSDEEIESVNSRRVTVYSVLGQNQTYENTRVLVNDVEVITISLDKNRKSQSFKIWVKPGDRYSLIGSVGLKWTQNGQDFTYDHDTRGSGKFSDSETDTSYQVTITRKWENPIKASLIRD